jgi:fatty-acid desaturase
MRRKTLIIFVTSTLFAVTILNATHHRRWTRRKPQEPPMAGKTFAQMDADGDGGVSRDEWMSHHAEAFSKIDKDGDGMIRRQEMKFRREYMMKKYRYKSDEAGDTARPVKKRKPVVAEQEEGEIGK